MARNRRLIDDLPELVRQGRAINATEIVSIDAIATSSWESIDAPDATFAVAAVEIEADPDQLRQLLENRFRNAIEHGGQTVTISVGPLDDEDGFFVEDDGPGIPEEGREDVYEAGMTTNPDGTGFGLAIVSEIVEAHGWPIDSASHRTQAGPRAACSYRIGC